MDGKLGIGVETSVKGHRRETMYGLKKKGLKRSFASSKKYRGKAKNACFDIV